MKVCFVENTSVINREHHLPLGSLTCEQLNGRGWDEYRLLEAHLDFFIPTEYTTAAEYLSGIDTACKTIARMKSMLAENRYYQMCFRYNLLNSVQNVPF